MIQHAFKFTIGGAVTAMACVALAAGLSGHTTESSQPQAEGRGNSGAPIAGLTRQPTPAARGALLDPSDTVILLLDHQTGLFQTVKDVPIVELRANTVALARIAKLAKAPIIYTASEPNGPNGPLMDELDSFKDYAQYVPRKGEISAWDNADFVKAVEKTGRKTLVIAGVWTSVCVAFPALQAKADGYRVYFVTDASGDPSVMASQTTVARLTGAGVHLSARTPYSVSSSVPGTGPTRPSGVRSTVKSLPTTKQHMRAICEHKMPRAKQSNGHLNLTSTRQQLPPVLSMPAGAG